MSWRTSGCGCGSGVGCAHAQPTPVCVVQGESVSLTCSSLSPVAGRLVRAEVRSSPGGALLLDMAPFAFATVDDPMALLVEVPGSATGALSSSGVYDVWVGDERVAYGPWLLELSVSGLPGRVAALQSWTPMLVAGAPFMRMISLVGMLPAGESVSWTVDPVLTVSAVDGSPRAVLSGEPFLRVVPEADVLRVSLIEEDTAAIGAGRFTYSLVVGNEYGERRTLLAGMMLVEEARDAEPYRG